MCGVFNTYTKTPSPVTALRVGETIGPGQLHRCLTRSIVLREGDEERLVSEWEVLRGAVDFDELTCNVRPEIWTDCGRT